MSRGSHNAPRRSSQSWIALVSLLGALFGLNGVAQAQTSVDPPASYETSDQFGVDLTSGWASVSSPTISVGDPGQGGLSFTATWDSRYRVWRQSTWGGINRKPYPTDTGCYAWYTVTLMGKSNIFQRYGCSGPFILIDGLGTFERIGTTNVYTAPDGTVATYSISSAGGGTFAANSGRLQTIVKPDSEVITYTYDTGSGGPISISNNLGYQLHFDKDSSGAVTKVTALNNAVDACSITAATCTYSRTWPSLTFGDPGGVHTVTDALGRTTRVTQTGGGSLTAMSRPSNPTGSSLTFTYRSYGLEGYKVATVSDGVGTWTYDFGAAPGVPSEDYHRLTTVTDPASHATVYDFRWRDPTLDTDNMLVQLEAVTNPLGQKTDIQQTGAGLQYAKYPEGNSVQVSRHEVTGALTGVSQGVKPGSGTSGSVMTLAYPADCLTATPATSVILCRRPISMTDPRSAVTNYDYDAAGNLLQETRPAPVAGAARPQTRYTYAPQYARYFYNGATTLSTQTAGVWRRTGSSACSTGAGRATPLPTPIPAVTCAGTPPSEVVTAIGYEVGSGLVTSNARPVTVSQGSGATTIATTTTRYDAVGNVAYVDGPLTGTADTTRTLYDAMRQTVGVIGPDPDGAGPRLYPATRTTFNADGQPTIMERGTTTAQTDSAWNLFATLQTATTAYDAQGRKTAEAMAPGAPDASLTQYQYDTSGRLTCSTVRMNVAAFGSATAACALGTPGLFGPDRITYNAYDAADRVLSVTDGYLSGSPITESQTYTLNGKTETRTDGAGNVSSYVYDGLDRVSRLRFPNASGAGYNSNDYEEWGYDQASNITSFRRRGNLTTLTSFDALNRPTLVDAPSGTDDVTFTYDNLDRQLTATAAGRTVASAWDALSRRISETTPAGAVAFQYDPAGRRTCITWPGTPAFVARYAYNLDNGVSAINGDSCTSGGTAFAAYAYDDLGRRTGLTRGNGVTSSWSYDDASRLEGLTNDLASTTSDLTLGFTRNPASQLISRSASNPLYAFVPSTGTTAYVNNGRNQVTSVGGVAISYDAAGGYSNGNIDYDGVDNYTYDAYNRLTGVTGKATYLYDALGRLYQEAEATTHRFLYEGDRVIGEQTTSGNLFRRYVPGPGVDEVAVWQSATPAFYWPVTDERGSVIANTTATGSILTAALTYDEYGVPGAANSQRFQYTGQMRLGGTGLYYYKARVYQPTLGRFLQTDPVGYEAGLNLYAYVGGDPVNQTDPTGTVNKAPGTDTGPCQSDFDQASQCFVLAGDAQDGAGGRGGSGFGQPPIPNEPPTTDDEAVTLVERLAVAPAVVLGTIINLAIVTPAGETYEIDAERYGLLREAAAGRGRFTIPGTIDRVAASELGRAWVGPESIPFRDGTGLRSADGLRQFRFPSLKPNSPYSQTGFQANFLSRPYARGDWVNNGHIDVRFR